MFYYTSALTCAHVYILPYLWPHMCIFCHNSALTCVKYLIHMFDTTHSRAWHDSWLIHMFGVPYSTGYLPLTCVTWLNYSCVLEQAIGWRKIIGCLKLQVSFRKRATNYGSLVQKLTYEKKIWGSLRFAGTKRPNTTVWQMLSLNNCKKRIGTN